MICCERRHNDDFEDDDDKNAHNNTRIKDEEKNNFKTNERTPNGEEKKDVSCRSTKLLFVLELSLFKRGTETTTCVFKRSTRFIALFVLLFDMMMMMMRRVMEHQRHQ